MPLMFRAVLPVLVRVTTCAPLVVPTCCDAKVREAALKPARGPSPVPESSALCGLPDALSLTESVATREPGAWGGT